MSETFEYVTYIAALPGQVFRALTDPELTKQYWVRHRNVSDWKVGSAWQHQDYDDASTVDLVGTVVEVTPPQRLVVTRAFPADAGNAAKHSRVTFAIDTVDGAARLKVTHEGLEAGSDMEHGIRKGWPFVLSGLKTLLETGRPMEMTTRRREIPPD
jgi:uncharacterized protein YndB with AHSA1/START domain